VVAAKYVSTAIFITVVIPGVMVVLRQSQLD
jgi:hypothetical protein